MEETQQRQENRDKMEQIEKQQHERAPAAGVGNWMVKVHYLSGQDGFQAAIDLNEHGL